MPINIYSVANHLDQEGWRLISSEYKNLKTELEMECPKGHYQTQTYEHWRKHPVCEKCLAGSPFSGKRNTIPQKKVNTYRLLALDAATNVTGYSIYDNETLVSFGTYHVKGNDTTERINNMKKWLIKIFELANPDFVGLEDIQLQVYGHGQNQVKTYNTLARLQGVLIDTCFEKPIQYGLVYASQWRKFCDISDGAVGRESRKRQAQNKVKVWYGQTCTQDEADAICIGKYFVSLLKNNKSTWGEDIE